MTLTISWNNNVWLSQAHICELFGWERLVITKPICNVFYEGELEHESVVAKFAITAQVWLMRHIRRSRIGR
jgi:hypothetical protein